MITRIAIEGFKSLEKVELSLGRFNLFLGANASGKSNFFEALRVLQGLAYGFTVQEIFDGKPKSAGSEVWELIRGGSARAAFRSRLPGAAEPDEARFEVEIADEASSASADGALRYRVGLAPQRGILTEEFLKRGTYEPLALRQESGFARMPEDLSGERGYHQKSLAHRELHDSWIALEEADRPLFETWERTLSDMQSLAPDPALLREYSQTRFVKRMGERGENFAALVAEILADSGRKEAYLSWLRQLTPAELDDVTLLFGALGEPLFALKEGERIQPAPILSDGTLRFAAITAAFFQSAMPARLTIEEIENGIHPNRLRLLVELLKTQAAAARTQIFATTHSPYVLAWLEEEDYPTTFLCKRDELTGASLIKPLSEIPRFLELARSQSVADLFAEGWLEGAV